MHYFKIVCLIIGLFPNQFNEQLISPKEFVCLAGKSTLKDWKRAIRLNSTMLRSDYNTRCRSLTEQQDIQREE